MKKYKKILALLILALLTIIQGCDDEEFLAVEPNNITLENFYSSPEEVHDALVSVYGPVKGQGLYGYRLHVLLYGASDRIDHEDAPVDQMLWNSPGFSEHHESLWHYNYRGIFRANSFLENVEAKKDVHKMDQETMDMYIAEVKFHRALHNFYLVVFFKNAIFLDHVVPGSDNTYGNADPILFWNQIEADLTDAISILPTVRPEEDLGRITKGAAMSLLAKAYLYKVSHYAYSEDELRKAKGLFEDVMNLGVYDLVQAVVQDSANYVNAFKSNFSNLDLTVDGHTYLGENNIESIYEIQYGTGGKNDWLPGWQSYGSRINEFFGPSGFKNVVPTDELVDQFESPGPAGMQYDPRRHVTVWEHGEVMVTEPNLYFTDVIFTSEVHNLEKFKSNYGLRKYFDPGYKTENKLNRENNWRVIRYSDILLMFAETCYLLNEDVSLGLDALNQVRDRVGLPAVPALTAAAIVHERDVEFAGELSRYPDLVRWSLLPTPLVNIEDIHPYFIPGKNEYFPIPFNEITLMEGKLQQNPGW